MVLCCVASFGCASASVFDASTTAGATTASNHFGFDLYARAKGPDGNMICSPASASIALTMASAGARGKTQAEMTRVLHLDAQTLAAAHVSFANLLAGSTDMALLSISFPQMVQLKQQWTASNVGTVGYTVALSASMNGGTSISYTASGFPQAGSPLAALTSGTVTITGGNQTRTVTIDPVTGKASRS